MGSPLFRIHVYFWTHVYKDCRNKYNQCLTFASLTGSSPLHYYLGPYRPYDESLFLTWWLCTALYLLTVLLIQITFFVLDGGYFLTQDILRSRYFKMFYDWLGITDFRLVTTTGPSHSLPLHPPRCLLVLLQTSLLFVQVIIIVTSSHKQVFPTVLFHGVWLTEAVVSK